jgi:formylglycine-generating enzyme required for sulfatase activity
VLDPGVPDLPYGGARIVRGGSWFSTGEYVRAFHRNKEFSPTSSFSNLGFRCAGNP